MKMSFQQYIDNPMGKRNAVFSKKDLFKQLYTEKFDNVFLREAGRINYALYVDEKNESNYVHMGSYGIGVDRCINSIVESYHDDMGIMWPMNIAPFKVGIIIANVNDRDTFKYAKNLYEKFNSMGIDCLLDDRKETVGVKFNDLDLIGVPIRITVGQNYSGGEVELKLRNSFMTEFIDTKDIVNKVKKIVENY